MIDLKVFKGEKRENEVLELLNALSEVREMYNRILDIAHSKKEYTAEQIKEAKQLTSGGFYEFISKVMSFRK